MSNPDAPAAPAPAPAAPEPNKPQTPELAKPPVATPTPEPAKPGDPPKPAVPEPAKPAAPKELVKDDLKLPEGSPLAPEAVDAILSFAKEKGLNKEAAQAVLERESNLLKSYVEGEQTKAKQQTDQWAKQASEDKEFGGENYKENAELASRVVTRFFSKTFLDALDKTGLGNYPEFVRGFVRIGRSMSEDKLVMPELGRPGNKPPEERLYKTVENPDAQGD